MIGWAPRQAPTTSIRSPAPFKVSVYGSQDSTDPYDPNCGNGMHNGHAVTGNNPADTSTAVGPAFVGGWVKALVARYGRAASGGVGIYQLDNEPALWNSTHRDVHPQPATYNELHEPDARLRSRRQEGRSFRRRPRSRRLGLVRLLLLGRRSRRLLGRPDRQAHGDQAFAPWYLSQLAAYQHEHGVRLLDYFDEHYYPQADGRLAGRRRAMPPRRPCGFAQRARCGTRPTSTRAGSATSRLAAWP